MTLTPRPATPEDIPELIRLRAAMFAWLGDDHGSDDGAWRATSEQALRDGLASGDMAAFVVDHPDQPGRLVACGLAVITHRLGSPRTPNGRFGHIQSMVTEPEFRRRGLARAILFELVRWCGENGARSIDLHASSMGEPLYRSMGFREGQQPELRFRLP